MSHSGPEKSVRYDRQIRLWGEDGQERLEGAKLLVLGAHATLTETVKNLVLPGVGSFTVVDGQKTSAADLGNNFFVTLNSIGESRAKVVTELLQELNEFVRGNYIEEDPKDFIEKNPSFLKDFTHVVAATLPETTLKKLAQSCWDLHIPLVVVRTYGMVGYIRVAVPEHRIVETKPDNPLDDLRLFKPFPELLKYVDSVNLDALDEHQHSHVPYPVLLIKALKKWKDEHNQALPKGSAEVAAFKTALKKSEKKPGQENINDAIKNAYKAYSAPSIPSTLREAFADPKAANLSDKTHPFWVITSAVKDFVDTEGEGALPLQGVLPDMTSDTESFIKLQQLYQDKANKDIASVMARVNSRTQKAGIAAISEEEVKKFCKNALFLQVLRYRSLDQEYNPETANKDTISSALEDAENNVPLYLLVRAVDRFFLAHNRYPGNFDDEVESDVPLLKSIMSSLLTELGLDSSKVSDDYIHEMCRFGGVETHPMASFMGGVASQEVLKLVTEKYVPLNNTFIYNAMNSTGTSLVL